MPKTFSSSAFAILALTNICWQPILAERPPERQKAEDVELELTPLMTRVGDDPYNSTGPPPKTHLTSVESVEFSPDEKLLITVARADSSVRLWRVADGRELWRRYHDSGGDGELNDVEAATFTSDGRHVVTGGQDGYVRVWTVADGKPVIALKQGHSIESLRFSHRGHRLAAGTEAGQIAIYDTSNADPKLWKISEVLTHGPDENAGGPTGSHADVNSVDFSADDSLLLSGSRNSEAKLWRLSQMATATQRLLRTFKGHTGSIKSARLSPDGKYVAACAGSSSGTRIWDAHTGELLKHLTFPEASPSLIMEALEWTPDSRYLFVGGNDGNEVTPDTRRIFRAFRAPDFKSALTQPSPGIEYFYFSKDGKRLLTGHNRDNSGFILWEINYLK